MTGSGLPGAPKPPTFGERLLVYFGLRDDPDGERTRELDVADRLAALEQRVAENTAAVESLRDELARRR